MKIISKIIKVSAFIFFALLIQHGALGQSLPYKTFNATGTGKDPGPVEITTDGGLAGTVSYAGGVYTWTVPNTGNYEIEAAGAAGGDNINKSIVGGYGAYLKSQVNLTAGTQINIVVGQKGLSNNYNISYSGAGGGGGSFVYKTDNTKILIAGGGGGAASTSNNLTSSQEDAHGKYNSTSGSTITIGPYKAVGGENGLGGNTSTRGTLFGAPGAGFLNDGSTANNGQGKSKPTWLGGFMSSYSSYRIQGGFGGGGGAGNGDGNSSYTNYSWSGGGGGYSGGGSGGNSGTGDGQYGGGGGSYYISGSLVIGQSGINTGDGYVKITQLYTGGEVVINGTTSSTYTFFGDSYDPAISSSSTAQGGSTPYSYQWQVSTDGVYYSDISLATSFIMIRRQFLKLLFIEGKLLIIHLKSNIQM